MTQKNTDFIKVKIPKAYDPKVVVYFFKPRQVWACNYELPSKEKLLFRRYLPKKEFNSERKAKAFALKKRDALLRGILTQKEHHKLLKNEQFQFLSFDKAIEEYLSLTSLFKSPKSIKAEKEHFNIHLKFFRDQINCKSFSEISESHVKKYRAYLLMMASKRKEAERKYLPSFQLAETDLKKREITKKIRQSGLSPATAKSYFDKLMKLFNKFEEEGLLASNPCSLCKPIKISATDQVRSKTFSPKDIVKIANVDYVHKHDFPIVEFALFLAETGARKSEALHLEWKDLDLQNRIWSVRYKKNCPTVFGLGWKPKWGKNRDVFLSDTALSLLEVISKTKNFGLISKKYGNGKDTLYPANFVFTRFSHKHKCRVRVDDISSSWKSLLSKAGIPSVGIDSFVLHDFRRYRNIVDECVRKFTAKQRGETLGNSVRVNKKHYAGEASSEILSAEGRARELMSKNLELEAKIKMLEEKLSRGIDVDQVNELHSNSAEQSLKVN